MGLRRTFLLALDGADDEWKRCRRDLLAGEDHEALHRLRLLVKRIRAWRRWLRPSRRTRPTWLRMRQAYREAGRIRDHAMHAPSNVHGNSPGPDQPNGDLTPAWNTLRDTLRPLRPGRIRPFFRALGRSLERQLQPRRAIRHHLSARTDRVRFLRGRLPDEATLHCIRRELKEMLYLLQLSVSAKPDDLPAKRFLQWLDQRQDQLGVWHDEVSRYHALVSHQASARAQEAALRHATDLEERAILALEELDRAGEGVV